jgi:hypothetical protein
VGQRDDLFGLRQFAIPGHGHQAAEGLEDVARMVNTG